MTEYNILFKAKIDSNSNIQQQLNTMTKSIALTISNIKIDPTALNNIKAQISAAINGGLSGTGSSSSGTSRGGTTKTPDPLKIDNQIQKWNNALSKMESLKPTVFASGEVRTATNAFTSLFDGFRTGTVSMDTMRTKLDDVRTAMSKVSGATQQTVKDGDNLFRATAKNVAKVAEWAVATTLMYGALKQIGEGIQYIKDLNKSMTDTQIVTGYTKDQIKGLASDYNNVATELGATTLEVSKGALEWQRQGKTIEETEKLLRASVMMAKLANMDQAASTEALTSIMNGYKLSVDEVIPTIDKLVALDNNYATSVQEISDALTKVSAVSKQSNVSLEEMAAMITVVSSDTRIAAESVGQSFSR
jgi:phage-related minor tail protein